MDSNYNKSFLDHFIVSENVDFSNVSIAHDNHIVRKSVNLSDHEPISLLAEYHTSKMKQKI